MALPWKIVQQILRDATEDESFSVKDSVTEVYQTLRELQNTLRGICEEGRVLTESEVEGSRFRYALMGGVLNPGPQNWLEAVEKAIQIVERCDTVAEIREFLTTHRRSYASYSQLIH